MTAADKPGVHREALALPVGPEAEPLERFVDLAAVLLAPPPRAREIRFAAERLARRAFLRELADEHGLGRDRGVVLTGEPVGVLAEHAVVARQHVHRRVRRAVAEVRAAR